MKITRIIEYEGTPEWLTKQLSNSIPDGTRELPEGKISIITMGNISMLEVYSDIVINKLNEKIGVDISEIPS